MASVGQAVRPRAQECATTMTTVAAPKYLGQDFREATPGLRFGLFLNVWERNWERGKAKFDAVAMAAKVSPSEHALMRALSDRQTDKVAQTGKSLSAFSVEAKSIAPVTTGLGIDHPLENGFAFLSPYGTPYLPGSSVKGVLREAARELAGLGRDSWPTESGWSNEVIQLLFGCDDSNDPKTKGLLTFLDVFPVLPPHANLAVEVMTPHHTHYYAGSESPHDSAEPTPLPFLAIPPKSTFHFHVLVDCLSMRARGATKSILDNWEGLLGEAFAHAFDWIGFGAKTSVGYGAMQEDPSARKARQREAERLAEALAQKAKAEEEAAALLREAENERQRQATLSHSQLAIEEFTKNRRRLKSVEAMSKEDYSNVQELANKLAEALSDAPAHERALAADALDSLFAEFGFAPTGLKSDKRKKRERKNQDLVNALREPNK